MCSSDLYGGAGPVHAFDFARQLGVREVVIPLGDTASTLSAFGCGTSKVIRYLDKEETGDGYRALSASCTHLGCGISWDQKKQQYLCPCHGGVFDRTGKVLAGPPPRAMDRFEARLNKETGDIEVEL